MVPQPIAKWELYLRPLQIDLTLLFNFFTTLLLKSQRFSASDSIWKNFQSFCITNGKLIISLIIWLSISVCNAKWLNNGKLRKAILSAFYNILQRNFGILLILWCSIKLWWNFCPDLSTSKFHLKGEKSIDLRLWEWVNVWQLETMKNSNETFMRDEW
jgi:hypothetical protein